MPQERDYLRNLLKEEQQAALQAIFLHHEVTLASCFYWKNRAPWQVPWRKCRDSFFAFCVSGRIRISLRSGRRILEAGEFLMLPELIPHALELVEDSAKAEQITLHCHIHDRWARPLLARCSTTFGRLPERSSWILALQELTSLVSSDFAVAQQRGAALIRELLAAQLNLGMQVAPAVAAGDARVSVVLEAMERELSSPQLSIEELSSRVGITPVHLRNLFRLETGLAPKRFLNDLRLRKATVLLRGGTARIKEVADACGFVNDHYFHLAFRTAFGCTPTEYRRITLSEA